MNEILKLLGVETEAEAIAILATFNAFSDSMKRATGATSFDGVVTSVTARLDLLASIEKLVESKDVGEIMGILTAWKTAKGTAETATAALAANAKKSDDDEVKTLLDKASASGKLAPAKREGAEKMYADYGKGAVIAHIDALPEPGQAPDASDPTAPKAPQPGVINTDVKRALTKAEKDIAKSLGLSDDEYKAHEVAVASA